MATYRPVDTRIWHDRKFLSLSDDGRLLWMFLLTTTFARSIPGVIVAGDGAMSEELGWAPNRLAKGFGELLGKGLAVKREGRLTWLPNALKYQPVGGQNSIIGMGKIWDNVPDGPLKLEIWEALKIALKSWSRLFDKHLPKPLAQAPCEAPWQGGTPQDQEQDQEQEDISARPSAGDLSIGLFSGIDQAEAPESNRAAALELAAVAAAEINRLSGSRYRSDSDTILGACQKLAKAKYTAAQVVAVIGSKRSWIGDAKMDGSFAPKTLLRKSNFANYLDEYEAKRPAEPRTQDSTHVRVDSMPHVSPMMQFFDLEDDEPDVVEVVDAAS